MFSLALQKRNELREHAWKRGALGGDFAIVKNPVEKKRTCYFVAWVGNAEEMWTQTKAMAQESRRKKAFSQRLPVTRRSGKQSSV